MNAREWTEDEGYNRQVRRLVVILLLIGFCVGVLTPFVVSWAFGMNDCAVEAEQ